MKKCIKYIVIFSMVLALGLFSSCSKDFLETSPTGSYSETTVLDNIDGLKSAVNGIHRLMYRQYLSRQGCGGMGGLLIYNDVMGDDVVFAVRGSGWYIDIYSWTAHRNKQSADARFPYWFYYQIIGNANMILEAVEGVEGSASIKQAIKGEALAFRGWSYLQLVQLYGKAYNTATSATDLGVPLVITATTEPQPRATVQQVYKQVVDDLKEAHDLLAATEEVRKTKAHFNAAVVSGLQARAALTMGNYNDAKTFAATARTEFSEGRLMDATRLMNGFNKVTDPEWMWGSIVIDDQTLYFYAFHAYMSWNFNSSTIRGRPVCINSSLYNKMSTTDLRRKWWEPNPTADNFPLPSVGSGWTRVPYMNRKFAVASVSSSVADIMYMRLSEMYLIEAEAKARLNDATAAQTLYDFVITRDPSYTLSKNTGTALIDEVLTHRRVELWGEGFRFNDLKRLGQGLDRTGANHNATLCLVTTVAPDDDRWQWHIPKVEEDANPNIVPND